MKRIALETIVCVVALASALGLGWRIGTDRAETAHAIVLADIKAKADAARLEALDKARKTELAHAQDMADIDRLHTEKRNAEINSTNSLVADLRAGTVRLRKSLAAAETRAIVAGQTGYATGLGDAARATGLQQQDAEFLLREAGRADAVVVQLQACQAIVHADRVQQ